MTFSSDGSQLLLDYDARSAASTWIDDTGRTLARLVINITNNSLGSRCCRRNLQSLLYAGVAARTRIMDQTGAI